MAHDTTQFEFDTLLAALLRGEMTEAQSVLLYLDLRVGSLRLARSNDEAELAELSQRIGVDRDKQIQVTSVRSSAVKKVQAIRRYKTDRKKLVSKGSEQRVKRLDELTRAAEKVRGTLRVLANQRQSLVTLRQEVSDHRSRKAPEFLRQAKERFVSARITEPDWGHFLLEYKGDVDAALLAYANSNDSRMKQWKGAPPVLNQNASVSLLSQDADLAKTPLALLEAEITRLQGFVNVDRDTTNKFAAVSKRIDEETMALAGLKEKLEDCKGAGDRLVAAQKLRDATYARIFDHIAAEEEELRTLYSPLRMRLE